MNNELLKFFATGKVADFGWVIMLLFAEKFYPDEPILSGMCIAGAVLIAYFIVTNKEKFHNKNVKK